MANKYHTNQTAKGHVASVIRNIAMKLKTYLLRKENIYLFIAISSGIMMAIVNPPFAGVPDETAHYWKAWSIAMGGMTGTHGKQIPQSARDLTENDFPPTIRIPEYGRRIIFHDTMTKLCDGDSDILTDSEHVGCDSPAIGFFPQAIGLRIGRYLHLSALGDFYVARICNLLVATLLLYSAIKTIPYGKIVLLVVGLLPMTIQQYASLSNDALHISACLLFIAYVIKLSSKKNEALHFGEMAMLFGIGVLCCNVKFGYFGLAFLVFLLPARAFRTKTHHWLFLFSYFVINILVSYLTYRHASGINIDCGEGVPVYDSSKQLVHVFNSPLHFVILFLESIYSRFNYYLESFLYRPGTLHRSLHPVWYVLLLAGMIIFVKNENENVDMNMKRRSVLLSVYLVTVFGVYLTQYLGRTNLEANSIEGVQGRYFICIAPLFVLFFYKANYSFKNVFIGRHLRALLIVFILAIYGGAFKSIYTIYYDKEPKLSIVNKVYNKIYGIIGYR